MRTLSEYRLATRLLKTLYIRRIHIAKTSENLGEILNDHPRLVVVLNHGPMMGALAGLIGLADSMMEEGGAQRRPFGITWRQFYDYPVTKQVLSFLTQIDHGVGFDEAHALINNGQFSDCVIMPEGELCNFNDGHEILPFLSPRFVELAVLNKLPILLAVHQGSESWAWPIKLDKRLLRLFKWLPQHMQESLDYSRTISVPKLYKRKIPTLFMSYALYTPKLTVSRLSKDPETRRQQLMDEAESIRQLMKKMSTQITTERHLKKLAG